MQSFIHSYSCICRHTQSSRQLIMKGTISSLSSMRNSHVIYSLSYLFIHFYSFVYLFVCLFLHLFIHLPWSLGILYRWPTTGRLQHLHQITCITITCITIPYSNHLHHFHSMHWPAHSTHPVPTERQLIN